MVTMNGEDTSAILPVTASTLEHTLDDDDDDGMSDDTSHGYDDGHDLMTATMEDEVTAQLAAAGKMSNVDKYTFLISFPSTFLSVELQFFVHLILIN